MMLLIFVIIVIQIEIILMNIMFAIIVIQNFILLEILEIVNRLYKKDFEFYKTEVDFGETKQIFHIGKGSVAIPGNIKGLLHIHKRLGKIPLRVVTEPAINIAKNLVFCHNFS